jgi:hypothetical protein
MVDTSHTQYLTVCQVRAGKTEQGGDVASCSHSKHATLFDTTALCSHPNGFIDRMILRTETSGRVKRREVLCYVLGDHRRAARACWQVS